MSARYTISNNSGDITSSSDSGSASSSITGSPIPRRKFPYPACWQDEQRMNVLFSPFRPRAVNPENYDSKMKFWQELIAEYCLHTGQAFVCKRDLQLAFVRKKRLPSCLDVVLAEMQRSKVVRTRIEYEYDPVNSWTGWAINSFVKRPFSWGLSKLKSSVGVTDGNTSSLIEYVHLEVIKRFCKDLQNKMLQHHQGKLLHYDAFKRVTDACLPLTEETLLLCLHTLHCQQRIGLEYKHEDKERREIHLIKIPIKGDTNIVITESEHAIHNLEMTKANLLNQLESLEADIKLNDDKARQHLKESNRQLAKTYLRKKHLLEKSHEKRSLALHNVETLLNNVHEAQSNGDILDAYKIGSKALQHMLQGSGLHYDNVDEVISDMRESMENHKEVQDMISTANLDVTVNDSNDNDALEQELRDILGESANALPASDINSNADMKNKVDVIITATAKPAQQVEITDSELLRMLESLEVEETFPRTSMNSTPNSIVK